LFSRRFTANVVEPLPHTTVTGASDLIAAPTVSTIFDFNVSV
jgi:hypothetical protein